MRWFGVLLALFAAPANSAALSWPALPKSGFVADRLATKADLKSGNAVFVTEIDGKPSGTPAAIQIPQYAFLAGKGGKRTPVVVVQAETNERGTFLGLRDSNGQDYVVTAAEVELLGAVHP